MFGEGSRAKARRLGRCFILPSAHRCAGWAVERGDELDCGLYRHLSFGKPGPPPGWHVADGGSDGYTWGWLPGPNDVDNGSRDGHWVVDSAAAGPRQMVESLVTRAYERGECAEVRLGFNHFYRHHSGDLATVEVQVDGEPWQTMRSFHETRKRHEEIDVTPFLGAGMSFRFRFRYVALDDQFWKIDDVRVAGVR